MDHPILDLDAAVSGEAIIDQENATISLSWGGTFEEYIQNCGDQIL